MPRSGVPTLTDWVRDDSGLSIQDIERKQPYKLESHQFKNHRRLAWLRCQRCGLVTLKNQLTEWCVRMGCNAHDHPEYGAKVRASRPKP